MNRPSADQLFRNLDELVLARTPTVDRPRGTAHPHIPHAIYPVDYGEVEGAFGGDGVLARRLRRLRVRSGTVALVLTCDPLKRDAEIKVLVDCTPDEVVSVEAFFRDPRHRGPGRPPELRTCRSERVIAGARHNRDTAPDRRA